MTLAEVTFIETGGGTLDGLMGEVGRTREGDTAWTGFCGEDDNAATLTGKIEGGGVAFVFVRCAGFGGTGGGGVGLAGGGGAGLDFVDCRR